MNNSTEDIMAESLCSIMKVFVTGGAGFIGRNIVSSMLKKHFVTIYDNLECSSEKEIASLIESGVSFVKGDVLDYDLLLQSCKDFDVVIHLAARSDVSESIQNPEGTNRVNVTGTTNVAKACVANKVKKIVFASSAAVYGECELPKKETDDANPISPYGKSKLSAESEIKKISSESGLQYVIFRIFNVYGKGQNENYAGVITKFSQRIAKDRPLVIFGDGKQTRDFVSVADVASAFEKAITSDRIGTYNIASGKKTSVRELADIMIESSGKKTKIVYEPEKTGDIKNSIADITLAQDELGFVVRHNLANDIGKML